MIVKNKKTGIIGSSGKFNIHSISEILVDGDTCFIKDYDVYIEATKEWKDLNQAFKDRDVICDNYNTYFFEPHCEEDRKRGYTLW